MFYGVNNSHLQVLRGLFPKLRLTARGNVLRLFGDAEAMVQAEEGIERVRKHIEKYNTITAEDIVNLVHGVPTESSLADSAVIYNTSGKAIHARSVHQQQLIDSFTTSDLLFAIGPAGTGKTYLSIALAVKALKEKSVKRIILSRPAVEAGEKLGFLPGDMKEKIDPYLQPLYDALEDMLPAAKLQDMIDKHVIQIAPLAFMRGRTLNDAIVILDEAQNSTSAQMKMFLTRLGWNSKMIITGDLTQVDLPRSYRSGLREAVQLLQGIEGISVTAFDESDIVRHKLVTRIVTAYATLDATRRDSDNHNEQPNQREYESINAD